MAHTYRFPNFLRIMLATGASLAIVAGGGCAEKPTQAVPPSKGSIEPGSQAGAPSSVRAYIDPDTGQLRGPTPEDIAAEAAEAARAKSTQGSEAKPSEPKEIRLPNGAIAVQLDESAQQPLTACVQKSGDVKLDHDCDAKSSGAK